MNKSIEFTQSQIKAYENGGSMFIFPITDVMLRMSQCGNSTIMDFAPIQKGDKDIFIKEDFLLQTRNGSIGNHTSIKYRGDKNTDFNGLHKEDNSTYNTGWYDANIMTKEQSRYTISECIDVRVIQIKDINVNDIPKIQTEMFEFDKWHGMDDYDYIFLIEVKR